MNIEEEVDILIDKIAAQLKSRMKKLVLRYEKQVLRDYISSVKKETGQSSSGRKKTESQQVFKKKSVRPKKESDYSSAHSSSSDSD
jgi:hypothetical protein